MLDVNVGSDTFQVGAIQKPDVVREELTRAARVMERTRKEARVISVHVKRLAEWARARAQKQETDRGRNNITNRESNRISFIVIAPVRKE